ncbi:MAG: hypothetical protein PHT54_00820 [Candidatus Nanoarchaeia archaeon]|nr:hypothetical protein [Candidatus Nanoarchaeia archaeon]
MRKKFHIYHLKLGRKLRKLRVKDFKDWENSLVYNLIKERNSSNSLSNDDLDNMLLPDLIEKTRVLCSEFFGLELDILQALLEHYKLSIWKQKRIAARIEQLKRIGETV